MFRRHVLPFIVWLFYRLWTATWRVQVYETDELRENIDQGKPTIFAMWHGEELAIIYLTKTYRTATLVSTSSDGDLMNGVLNRLGMKTSRGSSTRGGVRALKGLVALGKEGWITVVPVDGPVGPYHKAKPGVFELSRLLKAKIFPLSTACSSAIHFPKSWNKAFLPRPFAKVTFKFGPAVGPIVKEHDARSENLAKGLESSLDATGREAMELIDRSIPG